MGMPLFPKLFSLAIPFHSHSDPLIPSSLGKIPFPQNPLHFQENSMSPTEQKSIDVFTSFCILQTQTLAKCY